MTAAPHKAAALLLAAARIDPALRKAAEQVQDALIALDDEVERLRARDAEWEAGVVRTEWGARYADGEERGYGTSPEARDRAVYLLKLYGGQLVQRVVHTSPWTETTS